MMEVVDSFQCNRCNNSFNRKSSLNRHLRNIHKVNLEPQTVGECRIKCILCSFDQVIAMFPTYNDYNIHLEDVHQINVYLSRKSFESKEKFGLWCEEGFKSRGTKNMLKTGGSIKLQGTCPSRMIANFKENGHVIVQFLETHLGHEEEIRAQRLTKKEQIYLVDQMKQGVSKERIIANARKFNLPESGQPGRINSINMNDLLNLSRRHNVQKMKHKDLVATKAHQAADELVQYVDMVSAGKYQVGKLAHKYDVNFNCICNCKQMFCYSCDICIHSFSCTCYEFTIKSSTCKHIHVVAMYEKREQILYVPDNIDIPSLANEDALVGIRNEIKEFLMEKRESNETESIDGNRRREMFRERVSNLVDEICLADEDSFNFFERSWNSLQLQMRKKLNQTTNKRKRDAQHYFPEKKRRL